MTRGSGVDNIQGEGIHELLSYREDFAAERHGISQLSNWPRVSGNPEAETASKTSAKSPSAGRLILGDIDLPGIRACLITDDPGYAREYVLYRIGKIVVIPSVPSHDCDIHRRHSHGRK